jgi:hypothetical protein
MPNWCENKLEVIVDNEYKNKTKFLLKDFYLSNQSRETLLSLNAEVRRPNNVEDEFDWNVKHWGTKWEIEEVSVDEEDDKLTYYFDTVWSPPLEWLETVSKNFPHLIFILNFDEPGAGLYGGIRVENGSFVEEWDNDQPGEPEKEVTPEDAYQLLVDGETVMIKGWDMDEPRLYAGVTMDDYEGETKEEIISTLESYDSLQYW